MRRLLLGAGAILLLGVSFARLTQRWKEEAADHRVTLLVDWAEVRDTAARQGLSDDQLIQRLNSAGANAILVGASTVGDYLPQNPTANQTNLHFSSKVVGDTVRRQLQERGIIARDWSRLKDIEVGFNPELLGKIRQAGLHLILRINNDPWLSQENLFKDLQEIGSANQELGVLLNTDEVPGGSEAIAQWASFLESQNFDQLLFEFHPTKSSVRLGLLTPRSTFRAHTIASNELKDLLPPQQKSRWRRAVQERSCRFLLLHVSPTDSLASFLESIHTLQQDLLTQGWNINWPNPRITWSFPSLADRRLAPILALLFAIIFPVMALHSSVHLKPWAAYFQIFALTMMGAGVVAAVAQNPWTRIEIVPFRGIKVAFALAWLGSFGVLFRWDQIKGELFQAVRRVDVLVGLGLLAVFGYFLIRSGNASAGWKAGWEQGFRDRLEDWLIARPRFKEFAIGYPLLLLGLHWTTPHPNPLPKGEGAKGRVRLSLGRLLIGIGMIGPISMVNTFCHLHSPLYLGLWRSANGFLIGTVVGLCLLGGKKCLS